jgi:hypothetical protein
MLGRFWLHRKADVCNTDQTVADGVEVAVVVGSVVAQGELFEGGDIRAVARIGFEIGLGTVSLQYNLPATSLIIQSIPPSRPEPVTAEQE